MKNLPQKIYLRWSDEEPDKGVDWNDIPKEKITWSTEKENKWDVEFTLSPKEIKDDFNFNSFLKWFNEITGKRIRVVSDKAKKQIRARIREGYTSRDIVKAVNNCLSDPYHQQHRHYLTPEFISRSDKLEKYLNYNPISLPQDWYNRDLTESQKKLLTEQQFDQWLNNKAALEMDGKRLKPIKV